MMQEGSLGSLHHLVLFFKSSDLILEGSVLALTCTC